LVFVFPFFLSLLFCGFDRDLCFKTFLNEFFLLTDNLCDLSASFNLGTVTCVFSLWPSSSSREISLVVTVTCMSPLSYFVVPFATNKSQNQINDYSALAIAEIDGETTRSYVASTLNILYG